LFSNFDREDEEVQLSIVFAMRIIANKKSKAIRIEMMSDDLLTDAVRAALTEIVGGLGLRELRPIVKKQLQHPSARVRFLSCEALWMLHVEAEPDEVIEALQTLVSDPEIGWEGQTVGESAQQAIRTLSR
jgi:HEAT repeat protein